MNHSQNGYDNGYTFLPEIVRPRKITPPKQDYLPKNQLLNTQQAADYLGLKKGTLINWRCTKKEGIPYIKVGGRVSYWQKDLDQWLMNKRVVPEGWQD
jgi:excisionase family DNA binding protein